MTVAVRSRRYRENLALVQRGRRYSIEEAVECLQRMKRPKFDPTVNLVLRLGIDPRKSEQLVRGSAALPRGLGVARRVIVFADGAEAEQARQAGADAVGGEDLVERIQGGWTDFDVAVAIPRMMKVVSRVGKVLGPQGKMPSPKAGTVTEDVATAVREFKAGRVEYRNDAGGNVHAPVGKLSFPKEHLVENIREFVEHIRGKRPAGTKGAFVRGATLSATMMPGIELEVG
jgi:large subunit ribosomal protein L1